MDFITQTLLGAVAGHAAFGRRNPRTQAPRTKDPRTRGGLGRFALVPGLLGGAVPDADVLLQPFADPALPFELHRHFTHALLFIPIGGLIATLPLLLLRRVRRSLLLVYAAATIGCATHGLLDNLTSYGTHLLWPFSAHRTSWDAMSIVDPIFTGILIMGVLTALVAGRPRATRVAMTLGIAYIGFGFVQHHRAITAQASLARHRGQKIDNGRALPTIGNVIVFRSIYEADGKLWADAIRLPAFGPAQVREGTSTPRFTEADLTPHASERTREVFRGLEVFADGFIARAPATDSEHLVLGDMRISPDTAGFRPLWGIVTDPLGRDARAWDAFDGADVPEVVRERILRHLVTDVFAPGDDFRPLEDE